MKKRLLSLVLAVTIAATTLSGCGQNKVNEDGTPNYSAYTKEELIQTIGNLQFNYQTLAKQKSDLDKMYESLTSMDSPKTSIGVVQDGTGNYSFNSIDSNIIFDPEFNYPGSVSISPTGTVNIVNNVSVTPGSNWAMRMNGSALELQHLGNKNEVDGITGTILVSKYDGTPIPSADLMNNVLMPMFNNDLSPEQVKKAKFQEIFIGNKTSGVQATVPIMIDSENAFLRVGLTSFGGSSLLYVFVYRSEQDTVKDESIRSVIKSITIAGQSLNVND